VPGPFEIRVRVKAADIDRQGHVNNVVYLQWVQDGAVAHWRAIASTEMQNEVGWVALRHEIDYKGAAFLDDEVIVRTWVGSIAGLAFERHTEVVRPADRRLLAQARTLWCPINPETGRPKRVSAELRELFVKAAAEAAASFADSGRA
jgi:acyl-CoA thioester hydrolase